jgi:hypothetical protein
MSMGVSLDFASFLNSGNERISLVAVVRAIYSASVDDKAIGVCNVDV